MKTCDDCVNEACIDHLVKAGANVTAIGGYDKCVDLLSKSGACMKKRGDEVSLRKIEELSLEYLVPMTASPRSGCGTPVTRMLLCAAPKLPAFRPQE